MPLSEATGIAPKPTRICLSSGGVGGGGVGVVMLNLAEAFLALGYPVDLLLLDETCSRPIPEGVNIVQLGARTREAMGPLVRYLREARPDLVISARDYINLLMLAGLKIAGLGRDCHLIWTYHTHTSLQLHHAPRIADRIVGALSDRLIRQPNTRVAVSAGVARDLETRLSLRLGEVAVINNPIWTTSRLARRNDPSPHPWLSARHPGDRDPDAPVVLAVGRLTAQKDFASLLDSFSELRRLRPGCRLIILGEGEERAALTAQAARLGIAEAVNMPGHVPDPLCYMSRCDLFVLSSRWEGFPVALVEALGAGCPVVSTDCPSGPDDILEGGRIAPLVPPGNPLALAEAMRLALERPGAPDLRVAASLRFSAQRAAGKYLEVAGRHAEFI